MEDASIVMPVFDVLKAKTGLDIHVSTMGLDIQDDVKGPLKGYFGFYSSGAIRLELNDEEVVVQVSIWKKPGDLNKPDIKLDVANDHIENQIDMIVTQLKGGSPLGESFLNSEEGLLLTESARDDVLEFAQVSPGAINMKTGAAYKAYMDWAAKTGRKVMSSMYFANNLRSLKMELGDETADGVATGGSAAAEETVVEPSEEAIFIKDIAANEIFYKGAMYENILRRMAKGDPGIVSLFIYGSPGLGKTFIAKKILREEGVWESTVVYKSGAIAGFTGLLQLLWDNRQGKIIVLDDNDAILVGNINAANMLKACLNTDPDDRVVSYTKLRRN